jgi:hypothetical protein
MMGLATVDKLLTSTRPVPNQLVAHDTGEDCRRVKRLPVREVASPIER